MIHVYYRWDIFYENQKLTNYSLFNILKGEMSLIGPRPLTKENFLNYSPDIQKNYSSKPGLSGIGSIIFRKEEDF